MIAVDEQKRLPVLPLDLIYPIVDVLALDFDIENLDSWERHQRRLRREYFSKDLLNLRLVCSEFSRIVSPRIFRTLRLTHTQNSIMGFLSLMQSPRVNHFVQSVHYHYWDPEPHRYEKPTADDISVRKPDTVIRRLLSDALSRLHEFPSLRSLAIRFGEVVPLQAELDRIRDDLSSILDALVSLGANLPRPLESLSLTRLPPIHLAQYDHPSFLSLRANLSFFEIHGGATDVWSLLATDPLPPGLISPCEPFFYTTLPHRLLPPPSAATGLANLEALSLCFADPVGVFYLTYSFSELYFPRLRALRLQHVQFSVACDAERFITQHSGTLLELHLLHCQIAVAQNSDSQQAAETLMATAEAEPVPEPDYDTFNGWPTVPRPWSDIYFEFNNKLKRLVFLDVQDAWWISFPDRYMTYAPGEIMQFLEEGREDDKRALEMFQETVKVRAGDLTTEYDPSFPIRDEDELICDCH
ncbi:hypothetical protein BC827DRAFT_1212146 [Russula dissimulans]|nr:hypothetical protein BC827DRAFT_1212146 [Russula dissimulans]